MSRFWIVAILLLAPPAFAQLSHGYLFVAPGRETGYGSYLHGGVGGEWASRFGIGLGGEVGALGQRRTGPLIGIISGNGSYHFSIQNSKIDPFGTLGVSLATNFTGADILFNYGGGINYWFAGRFGARLEFRDHAWGSASRHLAEFRFGLSFR